MATLPIVYTKTVQLDGSGNYEATLTSTLTAQSFANKTDTFHNKLTIRDVDKVGTLYGTALTSAGRGWNLGTSQGGSGHGTTGDITFDFRGGKDVVVLYEGDETVSHQLDADPAPDTSKTIPWQHGFDVIISNVAAVGRTPTPNTLSTPAPPIVAASFVTPPPLGAIGGSVTLPITKAPTATSHRLTYSFRGQTGTITLNATTSAAWVVPAALANGSNGDVLDYCTITCTAFTAAGVQVSETTSRMLLGYAAPVLSTLTVKRCNSSGVVDEAAGTYLLVSINATVSSFAGSGSELNSLTYSIWSGISGSSGLIQRASATPSGTTYSGSVIVSGFDVTKSYDVRVDITDIYNMISKLGVAPIGGNPPLDLSATGAGFGKLHSQGAIDVNGDAYISGAIYGQFADTGWVNVTINSGFAPQSGYTPQVRRIGNSIYMRGGWSNTGLAANAAFTVGVVPSGFRPATGQYFRWGTNASSAVVAGVVNTNGNVEIRTPPNTSPFTQPNYCITPPGTSWLTD